MRQIIFFIFLISIFIFLNLAQAQYPQPPPPQPVFNFFFRIYNNDTVEFVKLEPAIGYISSSEIGDYKIKTVSTDGRILNESRVDIFFLYNKVKENGVLVNYSVREFVDVYLSLPYYSEASRLELYHFDKLIYKKDIPKESVSGFCGDNICGPGENPSNCPEDCFSGVTTTIPKTATTTTPSKVIKKGFDYTLFFIIIFVATILILFFVLFYRTYKIHR